MRIEMRLRCYLVISSLVIRNWLLAEGNGKKTIADFSVCSVSWTE